SATAETARVSGPAGGGVRRKPAARRRHPLLPLPVAAGSGHAREPRHRRGGLRLHLRALPLIRHLDGKARARENREVSLDFRVDVRHIPEPVSALEAYDWIDTTNLSQLVADFARVHMLVAIFDGDPQKWIEFLDQNATPEERQREMPVAQAFRRRAMSEP